MAPAGPRTNATPDRASAARQVARSSATARANQDAVLSGASGERQVGRSSAAVRARAARQVGRSNAAAPANPLAVLAVASAARQVGRSSAAARAHPLAVLAVALACAACGPTTTAEPRSDVTVRFVPDGRFFEAPFPAPWRVRADGTVDVTDFPTRGNSLAQRYVDALDAHGEGLSRNAGLWFPLSGAIDPATLPGTPEASASFDAAIYLVNVDETSAAHGQLVPLEVQFKAAVETYSPANLLVAIPRQGAVLAPGAWHAAVLTTALRDAHGRRLPRSAQFEDSSARGAQLAAELPRLEAVLSAAGRSMDDVVAVTLFRTGDHAGRLDALRTAARAFTGTAPSVVKLRDEPDFAVLQVDVDVPLYQSGDKPYLDDGAMHFDASGAPQQFGVERVRTIVTVPRRTMPAAGFPLLFHVVGSGGDADTMANGLAKEFSRRGLATFTADPNLTGLRHPSGDTSGFAFYNPFNPVAVRDNHRQQVAEYEVFAAVAKTLRIPGASVPEAGVSEVQFDTSNFFVHGHSTGSVVGAQILASNRDFRVGMLTGAGGSWLYNLVLKQATGSAELVASLLSYRTDDVVEVFDPILTLAATAWDPIEPMNQAPLWSDATFRGAPASVLQIAGLDDTFYLPVMQGALARAAHLDFVGPALEPEVRAAVLAGGGAEVSAPVSANRGAVTQAVVQHATLSGVDGHYVVFRVPRVKFQAGCWWETAARRGTPVVEAPVDDANAACP